MTVYVETEVSVESVIRCNHCDDVLDASDERWDGDYIHSYVDSRCTCFTDLQEELESRTEEWREVSHALDDTKKIVYDHSDYIKELEIKVAEVEAALAISEQANDELVEEHKQLREQIELGDIARQGLEQQIEYRDEVIEKYKERLGENL
jgi:chromosome segregation ATPase